MATEETATETTETAPFFPLPLFPVALPLPISTVVRCVVVVSVVVSSVAIIDCFQFEIWPIAHVDFGPNSHRKTLKVNVTREIPSENDIFTYMCKSQCGRITTCRPVTISLIQGTCPPNGVDEFMRSRPRNFGIYIQSDNYACNVVVGVSWSQSNNK